jgi:hypothetical protein
MRQIVVALVVVLLSALVVSAVGANPVVPPGMPGTQRQRWEPVSQPPVARMVIEADAHAKATRVQVPRNLLPALKTAALGQKAADQAQSRFAFWVMALTLGVALTCCGLRLARPRRKYAAAGLALVLGAVLLVDQEQVVARQPLPPIPDFTVTGQVVVEVVDKGDAVRLILAKNQTWPTRYER